MDEHRAIQRLKRGDIRGLEWLVNQFHEDATKVACLITGDLQQAEDVVQQSFLDIYDAIETFDDGRPFRPWFLRCVSNKSVRKAQEMTRQVPLEVEAPETNFLDLLESEDQAVEDQIEFSELVGQLEKAIFCLNPQQREAIIQRYFLDMSEKEMAQNLALPRGTVKWLLYEARKSLHALLSGRK